MFQNLKFKVLPLIAVAGTVAASSSVMAFAVEETGGAAASLPNLAITTDMLSPLVEGVMANVQVVLPVGLGLFAIFLGIRVIPGLVSRFVRM